MSVFPIRPVDVLGWGDAYCYFEQCSSLQEAFEAAQEDWIKETGNSNSETLFEVRSHMIRVLNDFIDRHNAPWASKGIKKELKKAKHPVSQAGVFLQFLGTRPNRYWLDLVIQEGGVTQVSKKIVNAELFNDMYTGNFSAFNPSVISRVLNKYLGYT